MNKVKDHLKKTLSGTVLKAEFNSKSKGEVLWINPDKIREVTKILKVELMFDILIDAFTIDWLGQKDSRFEMNYLFYHTQDNQRVQLKAELADNDKPAIDTITDIYGVADWIERECYDMHGIHFNNHPNLKRLLMWKEFKGHPLRKDYKINKRQPIPVLDELL